MAVRLLCSQEPGYDYIDKLPTGAIVFYSRAIRLIVILDTIFQLIGEI